MTRRSRKKDHCNGAHECPTESSHSMQLDKQLKHVSQHVGDALTAIEQVSETAREVVSDAGILGLEHALSALSGIVRLIMRVRDNDEVAHRMLEGIYLLISATEETAAQSEEGLATGSTDNETQTRSTQGKLSEAITELEQVLEDTKEDAGRIHELQGFARLSGGDQYTQCFHITGDEVNAASTGFTRVEDMNTGFEQETEEENEFIITPRGIITSRKDQDNLSHFNWVEYWSPIPSATSNYLRGSIGYKANVPRVARRAGAIVATDKKFTAGINKAHPSTDHQRIAKLDRENEVVPPQKVAPSIGKAIQTARMERQIKQKDLAQKVNEKLSVIQGYESGHAIPDSQILGKLERILEVKLRGSDIGKRLGGSKS